jgi:hypothetical protein
MVPAFCSGDIHSVRGGRPRDQQRDGRGCVLLAHALETEVRIRPIRGNEPKILIPNWSLAQRVVPDQAQLDLQPHAYEPRG